MNAPRKRRLVSAAIVALTAVVSGTAHAAPREARTISTVTGVAGVTTAPAATRGCPAPRTCPLYTLETYRWPSFRGRATVPFSVNPWQPWIGREKALAAVAAAAKTWSAAHPAVRFVAEGTTPRQPVSGDGLNEVAWGRVQAGALAIANVRIVRGKVAEADIVLNVLMPWTWAACAQRDGSCVTADPDAGVLHRFDVQAVLTHEFGHWLGIGHLNRAAASEQTMYTTPQPGDRKQATLALGDVRAIRAAYPCRTCRMPRIWSP